MHTMKRAVVDGPWDFGWDLARERVQDPVWERLRSGVWAPVSVVVWDRSGHHVFEASFFQGASWSILPSR